MKAEEINIKFHDLLNDATSVRNALYLISSKKAGDSEDGIGFLQSALEKCNHLIEGLQEFQKKLPASLQGQNQAK